MNFAWLVTLASVLLSSAAPAPQSACRITYVANAGVLFDTGNARFLLDTPIRDGIPPYATPAPATRAALEGARPPFDRITAILITHWHDDHFSPEAVAAHLAADPSTVLISSADVVDRVRAVAQSLPDARFKPTTPAQDTSQRADVGGVPIHVLRIRHNPSRRPPDQHVGFLIEGCRTVLHTGDADPSADNFTVLGKLPRVQVGLLPFWYVLEARSRAFVASSINPGRVLGMHLPPQEAAAVRGKLQELSDILLLTDPGQVVDLADRQP